ncbi:phenylacetate-CoA oxygenase subunit PaaC [Nisaea acidiphila]|uniref:Phenylacetate-CoA oxygenase subunit PaaC n=1 Tax=Nisaea acidiphila TaxID=1862145 RepID=A0A9J7AT02_9PROT|nr:1,2-phenylacetyl-CoA epoxidase subunit PaaC [Nisaea acidiphila]UUX50302.1 phenylacetate-CoA oxygenase subunit PaaC [Nisaea acidiphila]
MSVEAQREALFEYLLRLGDNALILGHRLSEWCGKGPVLEEDIALSNIALDLVGQANLWLEFAATVEGGERSADELAFKRDVLDWRNFLLAEQPNGDFAQTIVRQFLFDCFHVELLQALTKSANHEIAGIAEKALKEALYHRRHSGQWVIRLGDGTEESHARVQGALDALWGYTRELFDGDAIDEMMMQAGIAPDPGDFETNWKNAVGAVLAEATLTVPAGDWSIGGGKKGVHSEHLGFLLAEMQFLPRAYPDAQW